MKNRLLLAGCSFLVAGIIFLALFCPRPQEGTYEPSHDPYLTLTSEDINQVEHCEMDKEGQITITEEDANIRFNDIQTNAGIVALKFAKPASQDFEATLLGDVGDGLGFSESKAYRKQVAKGDEGVVFFLPDAKYKSLRMDVDVDYSFKSVDLYEGGLKSTAHDMPVSKVRYVLAVAIALVLALAVFFADRKFFWADHIGAWLKKSYKGMLLFLAGVCGCIVISALLEVLLGRFVFPELSTGGHFNVHRVVLYAAVLIAIWMFYSCRRTIEARAEIITSGLIILLGTAMILNAPFLSACWDSDSHYKWALNASYVSDAYYSKSDLVIADVYSSYGIGEDLNWNEAVARDMNDEGTLVTAVRPAKTTIAHRVSGAFMAVARFFGASFMGIYFAGRLGNLLLFALLVYLAMRKLHAGKMIMAVIALMPINLFLASYLSYDVWVTGFMLLGMAYFIYEMTHPEEQVTLKNSIIIFGAFALACVPKLIYAPLLLIPFFLKKQNFKNRKQYYLTGAIIFVLLVVSLLVTSLGITGGSGDVRGGMDVNPSGQIKYILTNPVQYARILVRFLKDFLNPFNSYDVISFFAYLGTGPSAEILMLLLIFTTITDTDSRTKYMNSKWYKGFVIALFFGMAALIATSLYVAYTPVAFGTINGCQPRYLIPLLFPMLISIRSSKIVNQWNRKNYNYVVLAICVGGILLDLNMIFLSRLL